ncbi:MAG: DNA polymerase III subunit delta [Clostridia bacterium]|nr:DNA polymerase III subunit delta [Clostridia bacterium]
MTVEELNKQIKSGNLSPVYFFYGEEQYLLTHKIATIEKKLIPEGLEDFNRFHFDGKKTPVESVLEAVEQFPQMSEKKVVVVKNSGFFNLMTSKEYKRLEEAFRDLPPYTCLIFCEDDFDRKKEKNLKLVESAGGGVVQFAFLPVNRVELWIEERFTKAEKMIAPKDVSYMVRLCGQSLGKLEMQIQKVMNYLGERNKVTREDIDAVVDKSAEYRIYDMLDHVLSGRTQKAQEQLKFLKDTKEKPTMVIGLLMGKLSELLLCKLLNEDGLSSQEIGEYFDFRRPAFVMNKTIQESKRYGERYLKRMIRKGLSLDAAIKSGKMDGWTAAEVYLGELTKRAE